MRWFYWLICRVVDIVLVLLCRRVVVGMENVPLSGPLLVISNHLSWADPPLLGSIFPRPIRFMGKEELFHVPVVAWVVRGYLAYSVRRGEADREAVRTTLRLLREGEAVGIFPEGTRSRMACLRQAHPGAALVAGRTDVPILPVGISGSEQLFCWPRAGLRPTVRVAVGQPFRLTPAEKGAARVTHSANTDLMMHEIADLLPQSYRGFYAGNTGSAG